MMRIKKILAGVLAAALLVSLAVLPAGAAGSSFTDVSDPVTALNADILRLMGVVDGVGGDQFNPGTSLTRAEFCTMVVKFMQKGDQVALHSTRTIFADVTARHWALGYVNLAASLTVSDGDKELPLISGVGNGKFEPDTKITLAQAATILIRVLGYSSQQAGAVWPQSYMNLARSIGLTGGITAGINEPITRAQAAQLFVNALSCKTGAGEVYYKSLGTAKDDTIILAVNVTTDDGSSDGAIRTTDNLDGESYLAAAGAVKPTALLGKRGALVLNDKNEIVSFVPDDSSAVTVTLSGEAQPSYVKGADGKQYTMSKDTLLYTADAREGKAWLDGYTALASGTQITMYSEKGKIVAVYAGGSAVSADSDAVVVAGSATVAMFHQLTGGASDFRIQKNRQTISLSDIKPYDVVTYDSLNNTLIVSDLRLACVYEDAEPNAKAPTAIQVLGHSFQVLDSAWDTIRDCSIGDNVILLLTADGKVAGMVRTGGAVRSTAIGMVSAGSAQVFLPNGGSLELKGTVSNLGNLENQLVTISSGSRGKISASKLSSGNAPGAFQVSEMKLGGLTVTAGVRVYEKVGSAMAEVSLARLDMGSIPAGDIAMYHLNSSGMVDYLVLKAVTGDVYTYGILEEGGLSGGSGDMQYTNRTVTVKNGTGGLEELVTGYAFRDKSFGGVAKGFGSVDGMGKTADVVALTEVKGVAPADFFVSQGATYVTAGGRTYRVADDVECYKKTTKSWFEQETGEARLSACKAYSKDLTIYVDPIGEKVRIVSAN
ncbi:S-layer homology domain-containing protein [Pseudoflavonifractor phocaeensis]|uniref:S-layer homology domain-containing protein n=1 Tax=Pseudoflavonifractor phocaeensis TaxID=1870988 RepID=UPI001F2F738C|nr:S-layer homology domain-containing protein [Pseudoflavonifractor phocaeensis]MCF2597125.1 S-layer homology domain-containing protein [Pseudoflavonifractor phocaeensis]